MDVFWKRGPKDLPFVHHTALDLICSNKLPFDGRLLGWPTPFQTLEEECDDTLLAAVVEEAKLDGQRHFALTLLESVRIPNAGSHQKDLWHEIAFYSERWLQIDWIILSLPLGAVRPMSLKPRTCSHCPSIWASIMLDMACVRTRRKRPCELCTSLDWRNRSGNPSNGSLLWSAIDFHTSYLTSTLPLFAALRRKISRDDLLKALRPIAEAHQPDNAADNGPWPRRCTLERQYIETMASIARSCLLGAWLERSSL